MTKTTNLAARLAAALDLNEAATPHRPEDNPFVHHTLEDLSHGKGILKAADQQPARNMAEQTNAGYAMEEARITGLKEGKTDKSKARMAAMRARARKKAEFDAIADNDVQPDPKRMTKAWRVVFPMVPIVTRIANSKERWAMRFLGSIVEDVPQIVLERMALVLAKSDKDLDLLKRAADELGAQAERVRIPGEQVSEDERIERKQLAKARKWLMGMANNRVQGTLVDLYLSQENLRWENLDIIATVMASINGAAEDPLTARFKADRAPAFLGATFQRPGGIDSAVLATVINAAITERGLDLMTEVLLNPDNRESGGAFKWTKCAERIFKATPGGGDHLWDLVCRATEHHARPRRARADAARIHARNQFDWLPSLIVEAVNAFDPHLIGYSATGHRAILASDFELFYLPDEPEVRTPLQPALIYASVEDAARALVEHIDLVDGAAYLRAVANA